MLKKIFKKVGSGVKNVFDKAGSWVRKNPLAAAAIAGTIIWLTAGGGSSVVAGWFGGSSAATGASVAGAGGALAPVGAGVGTGAGTVASALPATTAALTAPGSAVTAGGLGVTAAQTAAPLVSPIVTGGVSGGGGVTASGIIGQVAKTLFGSPERTYATATITQAAGNYLGAEAEIENARERQANQQNFDREMFGRGLAAKRTSFVDSPSTSFGPLRLARNGSSIEMTPAQALNLRKAGRL